LKLNLLRNAEAAARFLADPRGESLRYKVTLAPVFSIVRSHSHLFNQLFQQDKFERMVPQHATKLCMDISEESKEEGAYIIFWTMKVCE
jgi:hypothetical protein